MLNYQQYALNVKKFSLTGSDRPIVLRVVGADEEEENRQRKIEEEKRKLAISFLFSSSSSYLFQMDQDAADDWGCSCPLRPRETRRGLMQWGVCRANLVTSHSNFATTKTSNDTVWSALIVQYFLAPDSERKKSQGAADGGVHAGVYAGERIVLLLPGTENDCMNAAPSLEQVSG